MLVNLLTLKEPNI
uniref:Uncharacterized protein n=1 Tax=Anguilla anguilla TaxID=7936 RepID=A0A0E9V2J7_ANGAN